jgi:RHS repeat-associated protein
MRPLATRFVDLAAGFARHTVLTRWLTVFGLLLLALPNAYGQVVIDQGPVPSPASVIIPQSQWGKPDEYTLTFPYQACGILTSLRVEVGLDTGSDHATGASNTTAFTTQQQAKVTVSLAGSSGGGIAPATFTSNLAIAHKQPETWERLDVSQFLGANTSASNLVLKISVPNQASVSGPAPSTQRLLLRCVPGYQTYEASTLVVNARPVTPNRGYEQTLSWQSNCPLVTGYQIQLLFRPVKVARQITGLSSTKASYDPDAIPTSSEWNQRGSLIETESANQFYQLTLAEGEGTYHWRVRAIGNQLTGGSTNPVNWGPWANGGRFSVTDPDATSNWIYSRSFSEGGHVAEKLTFANGLQQVRQLQTRLTIPTQSSATLGQQVVATQVLQDFAGRDAVTSLPIPLSGTGSSTLGFRPNLLTATSGALYNAAHFDQGSAAREPLPANEQGYYSPTNDRVANAEGYPFTRTVFSNDGTNRVVEQGGVGSALRVRPTGAHTVRTSYNSVAPEEVIRLFGPEAPQEDGLYKIITTDPNNVSSVTYQGKDGKTIATALSDGDATTNLQPLASSGTRTAISEFIRGKGQLVSKVITLTSVTDLTGSYTLTPAQLQSACTGAGDYCSSCDYQVLLRVIDTNAEPGTAPLYTKAFLVKAAEQCAVGNLTVDNFTLSQLGPGTYRIERELVPANYYPTTGIPTLTSSPSATIRTLAQHLALLQAKLQAKFAVSSGEPWNRIAAFLDPATSNVAGLYAYLDSKNYPKVNHNGQQCYQILVPGCSDFIYFPYITDYCPPPVDLTNPTFAADLQTALDRLNTQYGASYTAAGVLAVSGYTPAKLNDLVYNMAKANPFPGQNTLFYDANELVNCWQGLLASLEPLLYMNTGAPVNYRFDIVREFLQCTGLNLLYPVSNPGSFDPARAYEQFLYDPNDPGQVNCVRSAGTNTATSPPTLPSIGTAVSQFAGYPLAQRNQVYDCLQAIRTAVANGTYTPGTPPAAPTQAAADAQAAQAMQQMRGACEDRRAEFRRVLLLQLHQQGQVVEGDVYAWTPGTAPVGPPAITSNPAGQVTITACQLEDMVQRLVEQCQHDVQLTVVPVTDPNTNTTGYQIGTTAQITLAQQALFSPLSVYANLSNGCPANLPAPVLPWSPVLQNPYSGTPQGAPNGTLPLQITSTARDLLTAISVLTARVNQEVRKPSRSQLNCPNPGQPSLLNEQASNVFSMTTVLSNWAFGQATTSAGEPNVYATLVDARQGRGSRVPAYFPYNYLTDYVLVTDRRATDNEACTPAMPGAPTTFPTTGNNVLTDLIAPSSNPGGRRSYWLRFVDPLTNSAFAKASILNISAPYIKFFPSTFSAGTNLTTGSSLGVTVTLLVLAPGTNIPTTREAIVQTIDGQTVNSPECADCVTMGGEVVAWKQINEVLTQNCESPTLCYAWSTQPLTVPPPPADFPVYNPQSEPCRKVMARGLLAALATAQGLWVDAQLTAFTQQFQDKCVALANQQETFKIGYQVGYHHFTLYYYDRAGNLMKTVPPAGVQPLTDAQVAACLPASPSAPAPARSTWAVPAHRLATTYTYNSLHQLEKQNSPDGGETHFFYNRKGQLRFSQNARQRADATPSYSYTRYDALGRVTEVGETTTDATNASATGNAELWRPRASLEDMSYPPATGLRQVTRTIYGGLPVVSYRGQPQRYLTNRVSYSYYDVDGNPSTQADNSYTYYSYDPHGNVEWLGQYQPQAELRRFELEEQRQVFSIATTQLEAKFVRYEYDLVSNKVTKVLYQEERQDQFYHRYGYDGDNRLTQVETSSDGQHWEQDARYTYFAHGPLKRLELGEDHVQGIDYTYTLQGWLKGLNHPGQDPGADGTATGLTASAKDAFGMVLGYYQGDFDSANPAWRAGNSSVLQPQYSLYNGNIAAWTSKTRDEVAGNPNPDARATGEQYRYDQLNRLTSSSFFRIPLGGGTPLPTQDYATEYSYDANGNLLTLKRNGNASVNNQPLAMDQLAYTYDTNTTNGDNRLLRVNDAVPDAYADDIKFTQSTATQYLYDAIGNLVSDNTGGVTKTISWNVYGKISQVQQSNSILVRYRYDAQGQRIRKSFSSDNGQNWRHVYYVRDASSNVLAVYEQTEAPRGAGRPGDSPTILSGLTLTEQPLYGSARLGMRQPALALTVGTPSPNSYLRLVEQKRYELTDHLSNVRALVSDVKLTDVAGTYQPDLKAYYNYYPFGMLQPNRNGPGTKSLASGYRYGFNSKEMDNNGELGLTSYDYGFRIYNPGIGRFLSVDPLSPKYAWYTPYQFAGNKPIQFVDIDGLEEGFDIRSRQMEMGYLKGTVSEKELREFQDANGRVGVMGLTALFDAFVTKGWLTRTYLAYTFADAIDNSEQSLKARNANNPAAAAYYANQSRNAYIQFGVGIGLIGGANLLLSSIPRGAALFRGTTEGYPGSRMLQQVGVTPASTDPVVATIFALESKNYGTGVLKVALPEDLEGVILGPGNTRAALESEVGVQLTPTEFSERASITITADQARGILGNMGIKLPSTVNGIEQSTSLLKSTPRLTETQIRTFTKAAQKVAK